MEELLCTPTVNVCIRNVIVHLKLRGNDAFDPSATRIFCSECFLPLFSLASHHSADSHPHLPGVAHCGGLCNVKPLNRSAAHPQMCVDLHKGRLVISVITRRGGGECRRRRCGARGSGKQPTTAQRRVVQLAGGCRHHCCRAVVYPSSNHDWWFFAIRRLDSSRLEQTLCSIIYISYH